MIVGDKEEYVNNEPFDQNSRKGPEEEIEIQVYALANQLHFCK